MSRRKIITGKTMPEKKLKKLTKEAQSFAATETAKAEEAKTELQVALERVEEQEELLITLKETEASIRGKIKGKLEQLEGYQQQATKLANGVNTLTKLKTEYETEINALEAKRDRVIQEEQNAKKTAVEAIEKREKKSKDDMFTLSAEYTETLKRKEIATEQLMQKLEQLASVETLLNTLVERIDKISEEIQNKEFTLTEINESKAQLSKVQEKIREENVKLVKIRNNQSGELAVIAEEKRAIKEKEEELGLKAGRIAMTEREMVALAKKFVAAKKDGTMREFLDEHNIR